jgi:hypothetical protein
MPVHAVLRYALAVFVAGLVSVLIGATPQILTYLYADMPLQAMALTGSIALISTLLAGMLYGSWFVSMWLTVGFLFVSAVGKLHFATDTLSLALAGLYEGDVRSVEYMRVGHEYLSQSQWFAPWQVYLALFLVLAGLFCRAQYVQSKV